MLMSMESGYTIYPCGDHAITIALGNKIDVKINQKVMALFSCLQAQPIAGVKDIIPSYHTVTVVYDLALLKKQMPSTSVYENMCLQLKRAADACTGASAIPRLVKIPVCYEVSVAPDIESVAALHQLSREEVIALHTSQTYRVYLVGFLPGFAYMGSVDTKIATPRKTKPRTTVAAGSVGIAGAQTGIYPFDSPGGWQLIGQTPVRMFDTAKPDPCYLQTGDEVQFYSINFSQFQKMKMP